jgi:hypothetical protein
MTQEQKEELVELMSHPGYPVLMGALKHSLKLMESEVLKYNLETGSDKQLSFLKCRAEGAAKLVSAVERQLEALNAKQKVSQ